MFTALLLLRVAAAWPLPGLGLLALPDGATPDLAGHALHTALAVVAVLPNGTRHAASATVEKVTRPDAPGRPARGLLLDFGAVVVLPPGTTIWLAESSSASCDPEASVGSGY